MKFEQGIYNDIIFKYEYEFEECSGTFFQWHFKDEKRNPVFFIFSGTIQI